MESTQIICGIKTNQMKSLSFLANIPSLVLYYYQAHPYRDTN